MNHFGRHPVPSTKTARGKQVVAGAIIMIAIALDLVAASLSSSRAHAQTVGILYGLALAVLLAGLVFMILNRKRTV